MASPDITSHHVNYLIWRYLQESGHGEAAVMLQRAWNPDPQALPFAPYIKTHALVTLVQKGLQYHEIEQSLDQARPEGNCAAVAAVSCGEQDPNRALQDGNPVPLTPSKYFFGPIPLDAEKLKPGVDRGEAGDGLGTDQAPASPASKAGVTNGHATAEAAAGPVTGGKKTRTATVNGDESAMDIDSNGVAHERAARSQSPAELVVDADGDVGMGMGMVGPVGAPSEAQDQEPAPAPTFTLTTGQSVGVQISPAKAADLSPDTAVLDVAGDLHVTRCLWRPRDSTVVATAGEAFCSLWKLSGQRASTQEKLVESTGDSRCVSAIAWDPTGQKLAVATYNDLRGSITMYNADGEIVDMLPDVPRMITGLHWADNGAHMVVVASDSRVSELALWDASVRAEEFPPPQVIDGSIYDLVWSGDNQVYACGDGSAFQCDVNSSVQLAKTFSSGGTDTAWTFIRCAKTAASPVVVTASSASASIWVPAYDIRLDAAHDGDITAIELRPRPSSLEIQQNSPIMLASSSTDDTVKLWNVDIESKEISCLHRLYLGPSIPALISTFSPDGYAIAAASKHKLFIWNAERGGVPMATWTVPGSEDTKMENPDEPVNGQNGSSDAMPDRSLSWDTDGKKLAFGFGKQMAIVNFQR
ncbi:hypothetical protein DTO027B5_7800 [Paecilomyces variotii]|nr:hypothetical protein DTO169C6_4047 [Paecilomyces variotii]KAJ9258906.1 hypothetical protein DTO212C5_8651 [Paecilomyces variotii]KAJ9321949.1 hypothetical protein DTO027B3_7080 [Paecilomyces variotii]KAJ9330395.1 hypothetical protein DTO027B5_7800 [Paecilomyces variotii]